ncbi:40S ribosomal protein SA [Triticum urartu]|uniref:40S ribosomal protein SA n=1 Tax=Triticum urartu TaxID=4572 RepID=M7ZLT3_TRIUA|nr:40S ribosomal protein SA [Triticum urartu]
MAAEGGGVRALSQREQDIQMMLAADVHLGTKNCDFQMERYVYKRRTDGIYIINLGKTWEKLQMAARVIVAIENPQDIIVQSARPYGQRAVLKFAQYTGANAIAGRHTPGTFTNQMQTSFSEPRLLILTDPRTDHQMRGTILPGHKWEIMVDLFFYRDPEEAKELEEDEALGAPEYAAVAEYTAPAGDTWGAEWPGAAAPAAAIEAPAGAEWTGAPAPAADGWDAVAAPAPTGWEQGSAPAPAAAPAAAQNWE